MFLLSYDLNPRGRGEHSAPSKLNTDPGKYIYTVLTAQAEAFGWYLAEHALHGI